MWSSRKSGLQSSLLDQAQFVSESSPNPESKPKHTIGKVKDDYELQRLMKVISLQLILYLATNRILKRVKGSFLIEATSEKRGGIWFSVARNQDGKIVACSFSDRNRREAETAVKRTLQGKIGRMRNRHMQNLTIFQEIYRRFSGKRMPIKWDELDLTHASQFQKRVYRLLCQIPHGRVTTYGAVARRLGGRRYARAVGTAVASNPLPLIIPCHRVVPASLTVGNYGMPGRKPSQGGYMKRRLLEREGVKFVGATVSRESVWTRN
jgi:methylated-DNA-[protein]-cysteine S-methyltransferase